MWTAALSQSLHRILRPKSLAIFEACFIGLISALAAVALKQSVEWLISWRSFTTQILPIGLALPGIGILGGFLSGWLIERLAPEVTGSGIPQLKAALSYFPIALDLRVAIVKMVSTSLALGAGLALGRQGPTVQIGAALAAQLSRWVETSPAYQRQLLAAGAAAGLAAGFNAPIAGVLFVVEELLQDVSDFTLGTAILASFVGGVVSRLLGRQGLIPDLGNLHPSFSPQDIPVFLIIGVLSGILGGWFSRGVLTSLAFNRYQLRGITLPGRMALAGGITGIVLSFFPAGLRHFTGLQDFLLLGNAGWTDAALIFIAQFCLGLIAFGAGTPGGLFAPSLILGSALGTLIGAGVQALQQIGSFPISWDIGTSTIYALTGMSAFFSAVTRGPITAIVIVFEMTADFELVLPLMIGSVTSYLVAEKIIQGSIYKHLLEWRGIHIEGKGNADQRWEELTAADIMQCQVEKLTSQMTVSEALQAFSRSEHRGFPVVDEGRLIGILTQTDLSKAVQNKFVGKIPIQQIMTTQLITASPTDSLTHVLHLLNHYQIGRLPVIEGRKLLGIITRTDIIRAESAQIQGEASPLAPKPEPSYVVYQTRAPATGKGRILVPLSNPQTADALLRIAAEIALSKQYELECLHIILVPRHCPPSETIVDTHYSLKFLGHATEQGRIWQIPMHTQIRVGHNIAHTILETIQDRHIDLLLMGWEGSTSTPKRVFGDTVDTLIHQAACDLLLVKLGERLKQEGQRLNPQSAVEVMIQLTQLRRWLVPIAGGPNAQHAIKLLPTFITLSREPEIRLCQVFHPNAPHQNMTVLAEDAHLLRQYLNIPVIELPVCAASVPTAIIDMARHDQCDVIVMGASGEGLLQQVVQGNIPEAIARDSNCTVILVRKAL